MKRIVIYILLSSTLFSSCSLMFRRKKVELNIPEGSTVYVKGQENTYNKETVYLKPHRFYGVYADVEKEGYYTRSIPIHPDRVNAGTYVGLFNPLNIPLLGGPAFFELFGYHKNFKKEWDFELEKYPELTDSLMQINVSNVIVDDDFKFKSYHYKNFKKYEKDAPLNNYWGNSHFNLSFDEDEGISENSYFELNKFLMDMGLLESQEIRLVNFRDYTVRCTLKRMRERIVQTYRNPSIVFYEMEVNYLVKDKFGKVIYDDAITSVSDQFFVSTSPKLVFMDAFRYGLLELFKKEELAEIKEAKHEEVDQEAVKTMEKSQLFDLSNAENNDVKSIGVQSVYLKSRGKRIIALPISKDGLVALSKRAIEYNKNEDIVVYRSPTDSSSTTPYFEMGKNEMMVLKTDFTFDQHFSMDTTRMEIGDEVVLAGYDRKFNTLLLSKGVITGEREQNRNDIYQLDAEANYMIYPIVLSTNGRIKGFISKKLDSYDINSISFFPALQP